MRSSIVSIVLVFAALGLLLGYSESFDVQRSGAQDIQIAVANVEDRIGRLVRVMETTGDLPQVRGTEYIDLINVSQMGIPEGDDVEKRQVAREILSDHAEIASIFFLTPDGDIYIGEPYEQQEQLPRLNYADRDWYKGVRATGDAYVSSVFISAAIHMPAIAIAVPVYTESGSQIAGYWVAIVGVSGIDSSLKGHGDSESRILLVDHNGTQVVDTGVPMNESTELRSFVSLQSVENALAGQSGTTIEQVDGQNMAATYAPVRAHPHTWGIVFLRPAPVG